MAVTSLKTILVSFVAMELLIMNKMAEVFQASVKLYWTSPEEAGGGHTSYNVLWQLVTH